MAFTRRRDAVYLRDLPALRRVVPYLMRTRAESVVFYPQRIEVEELLTWLQDTNAGRDPSRRITLFHVLLTAIARTVRLRPEVNRFVAGRRTYEHKQITISFVVKKAMTDAAPETEVRLAFSGEETVDEVREMVDAALLRERGTERGNDDKLVDFFASWPRPALNLVSGLISRLDYHNLLPEALRDAIPLFTSVYVVNLGSVGADAPFHHLYEVGSASVFVAIGRVAKQAVVDEAGQVVARDCLNVAYTLDERASDGFYFARTAEVFRRLVAHPGNLEVTGLTVDELLGSWPRRG